MLGGQQPSLWPIKAVRSWRCGEDPAAEPAAQGEWCSCSFCLQPPPPPQQTLLLWFLDAIFLTPPLLYSPLSHSTEHPVVPPPSQHSAPLGGPGGAPVRGRPGRALAPPAGRGLRGWGASPGEAPAEGPEGGSGQPGGRLAPPAEETGRGRREEEGGSDLHRWGAPGCEPGERGLRLPLREEPMERLEAEEREAEAAGRSRVRSH